MRFYYPSSLYLLIIIIPLLIIGIIFIINLNKRRNAFISFQAFEKIIKKNNIKYEYISLFVWLIIISLSIITLARPLGDKVDVELEEIGRDIIIAVDISDSMRAIDGKNPSTDYMSRLDLGKWVVEKLVSELKGERVSLITFSDIAFPILPLTNDYEIVKTFLSDIDYSYSNTGSTDINEALNISLERLKKSDKTSGKLIILISDGEDQNSTSISEVKKLKDKGIFLYTIGIGSEKGSKIPLGKNIFGKVNYKTYMNEDVITKKNSHILKKIAKETGGYYFDAKEQDLLKNLLNKIEKIKSSSKKIIKDVQYQENFQIFIILIILMMFFEIFARFNFRKLRLKIDRS